MKKMRRFKQQLTEQECITILQKGTSGVLAVCGEDGPYAIPLSYVYDHHKIFFHCALQGHKLDAIKYNPSVSFCVIDQDKIVPEEFTTYYRSVILFGQANILQGDEKRKAIECLAEKYSPEDAIGREKEIEKEYDRICMIEIDITKMSGKQAKELMHN